MNYEEKYKDALERAKNLIALYPQDAPGYREVFPDLAESEDERIRKELIGMIKECTNWVHKKEYITYLEKQKENPKSSDSIPPDCTSDAKYEDRWHKVTDSMPDNPREVLCKDEAGNYFIGRYYVGEGWEISNYDDEDTPHHLNPPVSKWIDFPLEKRKESLRDFIDDFPYSDEQKEQKPILSDRDSTDFEIEVHEIIAQARNDSRLKDADVLKQFEEEAAFALMLKANKLIGQKPGEVDESTKKLNEM